MEYNQTAADGTVYDNGYGICMIPRTYVTEGKWNSTDTLVGGYKSSTIHTELLPTIVNNLRNVLGSHIVTRNVLLSGSVGENHYSNGYTWTTADATLMSVGQITGEFASHNNKYDDGEANYKLPLFDTIEDRYLTDSRKCFFTRNIYSLTDTGSSRVWSVSIDDVDDVYMTGEYGVRPLIYLR